MKEEKKADRISNLTVNLMYFALGVSFTAFSFTGYNLVNRHQPIKHVVFEDIDDSAENYFSDFNPTRYDNIVYDNKTVIEYEYSGMNLDNEYEDYIRCLCDEYASEYDLDKDKLFKSVLVIGDQESNGTWDCNGKISTTDDYGEFQINVANHKSIEQVFGYTTDELLNDKEKNADAAVWIISNIMISDYCKTDADIYGMYNGWINWQDIDSSVQYVDCCLEREKAYFPEIKYFTKR